MLGPSLGALSGSWWVSMMTAAQTGLADEASLRATPVAYHESALGSGSTSREDDCCDDGIVAPLY